MKPLSQKEIEKQIRDRNLRNQQKRVAWENQCQHLDNLGPILDGIPWEEADIKFRSYIYLCLGTEGQRIDTILSGFKNSNNFNQRLLGQVNTTFCKGTKCDIRSL